jgi:hypothetical protein
MEKDNNAKTREGRIDTCGMVLAQALHLPGHSTNAKQKASEGTDSNADAFKTLSPCHITLEYLEDLWPFLHGASDAPQHR